jgi:hypothetical protein
VTTPTVLVVPLSIDELRALFRAELDAALAALAPPTPSPLLDKRGLAHGLGVSVATVTRMGLPPTLFAGASPRYDLEQVKAYLAARGRNATHAKPSTREVISGVRRLSRGGR